MFQKGILFIWIIANLTLSACGKLETSAPKPEPFHSTEVLAINTAVLTVESSPSSTMTPLLTPAVMSTPSYQVIENLSYKDNNNPRNAMDVYLPANSGEELRPVVLMLHQGGETKTQFRLWGQEFATRGYVAIAANYRGWPNYKFPQDLSDAFCALAWVYENGSAYNLDIDNVFVLGHSSGGTLAGLLGVIDTPEKYMKECPLSLPDTFYVKGIITFTGIFDYAAVVQKSQDLKDYADTLLGGTQDEIPDVWTEASAITWIDGSEPAFLIMHGGADANIPPSQSVIFSDALKESDVDVEVHIVVGQGHTAITTSEESMQIVMDFIARLVQN